MEPEIHWYLFYTPQWVVWWRACVLPTLLVVGLPLAFGYATGRWMRWRNHVEIDPNPPPRRAGELSEQWDRERERRR